MLLFRSETWVVTPCMGKALWGFQYQVARRLTGRLLRRTLGRKWTYNSEATAHEEMGFLNMEE